MNFRSIRPSPQTITEFSIPELNTVVLNNGMPAFIHTTKHLEIVKFELFWAAGSHFTTKPFLSHLASDLLFSGNTEISEEEIIKKLDFYGASYSMDSGINTSSVSLRFQKKHASIIIPWIISNIDHVKYPQKEVDNAIMIKSAGIERQQQTPKYWSNRITLEKIYGDQNPLSRFGEVDDLKNIQIEDLREYHDRHLLSENSMVFLSGDIDDGIVNTVVQKIGFGAKNKFSVPEKISTSYAINQPNFLTYALPNSSQVSIQMGKHIKPKGNRERHVLTLLNLVLGGYFGSRLMQELREKQGLTYGIGSYFKSAYDDYTWIISGEMNSHNIDKTMNAIRLIFEDLKTKPLDYEELNKIKQYYSGIFRSGFDGPFSLSTKLQSLIMKHQDSSYYATVLQEIWSIQSNEIHDATLRHLDYDSFVVGLAGKI